MRWRGIWFCCLILLLFFLFICYPSFSFFFLSLYLCVFVLFFCVPFVNLDDSQRLLCLAFRSFWLKCQMYSTFSNIFFFGYTFRPKWVHMYQIRINELLLYENVVFALLLFVCYLKFIHLTWIGRVRTWFWVPCFWCLLFFFLLLMSSLWLVFDSSFFWIIDLICLIQYLSMSFYHCLIRIQCPSNICNICLYICMYLIRLTSLLYNRKVLHIYVKSWFNRRTEQTFTLIVLNTLNDEWFL